MTDRERAESMVSVELIEGRIALVSTNKEERMTILIPDKQWALIFKDVRKLMEERD